MLFLLTIFWALFPRCAASAITYHEARSATNTSKAGLAWPNGNSVDMKQYTTGGKVSWYYTWSPYPARSSLEFVPMLWGNKDVEAFSATIEGTLKNIPNITAILGMNEPEQAGQSNMTAQEGAQFWQTHLQPFQARGLRLGSPAISSAPSGKVWLQDFFTTCAGNCTVSFIAAHWYGKDASQFIDYVKDLHQTFQLPIWITEWACQNYVNLTDQCTEDGIVSFMNTTQTFLDSTDFVERYAWFGAMKNMSGVNPYDAIMDSNGKINALGSQYSNSTAVSDANSPLLVGRGYSQFLSQSMVPTLAILLLLADTMF